MKKVVVLLLVLVLAALAVFLATRERYYSATSSKALDYYQQGVDALMKFYFEDGRNYMELAVQEDPEFPLPYLFLLRLDFGDVDREQKTAWFKKLANPEEHWTPFERRLIEMALMKIDPEQPEEKEQAKQKMEEFLREYASRLEVFYLLLQPYMQLEDDPHKLVAYYERLHHMFPNNVQILNQLGYFYVSLGEPEKARSVFEKYVFIRPDEPNPYDSYGEYLYNTGQFGPAEDKFRKALEKKPDFLLSRSHLALALIRQGKIDAALIELNELESSETRLNYLPSQIFYYRLMCYQYVGDMQAIDKLFRQLEESDLMYYFRLQMQLDRCFLKDDLDCARDLLDKIEKKRGKTRSSDYRVNKARLLMEEGEYEASDRILADLPRSILNAHFDIRNYVYYILIRNQVGLENRSAAESLAKELPAGYREYHLMRIAAHFNDEEAARNYAEKVLKHFESADPDFLLVVEARRYAESGNHDQDPEPGQVVRWVDLGATGPHCRYAGAG